MSVKRRMPSDESTNNNDCHKQRKRIRTLLEERLVKKFKGADVTKSTSVTDHTGCTDIDINAIKRQAAVVEDLLYRKHLKRQLERGNDPTTYDEDDGDQLYTYGANGDDFTEYNESDINDHDEKINTILNRQLLLFLTQATQKRRENQDKQNLRQVTLLKCLGADRYRRAIIVLKKMDQIGVELTGDCCIECPDRMRLSKGSIPYPVRQLFHQTSLRTHMYFTPISQLHSILWDDELNKAEHNINEYISWTLQCKPNRLHSSMSQLQLVCHDTSTTRSDTSLTGNNCIDSNAAGVCTFLRSKSCP